MPLGQIVRMQNEKGFGFIKDTDTGKEFFFHKSAVNGRRRFADLKEGDRVEFEIDPDAPKGPRAESVEYVS